jgi:hypothetical protein
MTLVVPPLLFLAIPLAEFFYEAIFLHARRPINFRPTRPDQWLTGAEPRTDQINHTRTDQTDQRASLVPLSGQGLT